MVAGLFLDAVLDGAERGGGLAAPCFQGIAARRAIGKRFWK